MAFRFSSDWSLLLNLSRTPSICLTEKSFCRRRPESSSSLDSSSSSMRAVSAAFCAP